MVFFGLKKWRRATKSVESEIKHERISNAIKAIVDIEEDQIECERKFVNLLTEIDSDSEFEDVVSFYGFGFYRQIAKKISRHKIDAINKRFESLSLNCRLKHG